jgi:hypothetical protein
MATVLDFEAAQSKRGPVLQPDEEFQYAVAGRDTLDAGCKCFSALCCCCATRVGNMMVLWEKKTVSPDDLVKHRSIYCVVGPYWPVMVFITFPLFIIVSKSVTVQPAGSC